MAGNRGESVEGRRLALVVAVDRYLDHGLSTLRAPAADAGALAEVLGDPDLGGFDVTVVRNERSSTICEHVEQVLADCARDDLVVLHFSCHGLKDDSGELFLAATNTVPRRLASTAVDAALVSRLMQRSLARRVVLLLDCCYGGAFERGMIPRSGGDVDVGERFLRERMDGGRGRAVVTASTAMQYAFEGHQLTGSLTGPSLFTGAVVEGIRTGDADLDQDGWIALGELYEYVYDYVRARTPNQTPCKWEFGLQGGLYLARNPRGQAGVPATNDCSPVPRLVSQVPQTSGRNGLQDELPPIKPLVTAYVVPVTMAAVASVAGLVGGGILVVLGLAGVALLSAVGIAVARQTAQRRRRLLEALIVRDRQRRTPPSR